MVNRVTLVGRLGKDPELRFTQGGQAVAQVSVATDESFTDKQGQKQKKTEWHKVVVWGKQAESVSKYLAKGSLAYIEGKLQTREWEKDGVKRYMTEVVAQNVRFLDFRKDGDGGSSKPAGEDELGFPVDDDSIPF